MRIRDLLLQDDVTLDRMNPCYDRAPDETAFVIGVEGDSILAVTKSLRVFVPMVEGLDADTVTLALVKVAAEQGSTGIEWSGSFQPVQKHFNDQRLPFHVVLRHPESPHLVPPPGVQTLESADVDKDRFYCLTTPELLGRRPTRPGVAAHGVACLDEVGFLIFNPKGILTVFFEVGQRRFAIPAQA